MTGETEPLLNFRLRSILRPPKRSFFTKNALFDSNTFMSRSKSSTLFKRAVTSKGSA